ncbi:hypothetical protein [Endozoicomonas ascidiicola]|uniref:hypothetical protein n=1 Tax=Endozoicomonas ascidiicola TaxID=1698521 RepID=UPI00082E8378|nr:hypothetical protein [Endozoicomonas ascidiicola]
MESIYGIFCRVSGLVQQTPSVLKLKPGRNVKERYLKAVFDYYGKASLDAKQHWITEKLIEGRISGE